MAIVSAPSLCRPLPQSSVPLRPQLRPTSMETGHGRRDYPRPLRKRRDWPRNRPRPNSFYGWIFRFLRDSVGRPRFCLGACPDECSGWPAHRPWDRTVRAVSRQRDLGGSRALRSLPTAPNAHFLHGGEIGARYPDRRHASPLICLLRRDWRSRWRGRRATVSQLAFRCRGRRSSPRATISSKAHSVVRPPRPSTS